MPLSRQMFWGHKTKQKSFPTETHQKSKITAILFKIFLLLLKKLYHIIQNLYC